MVLYTDDDPEDFELISEAFLSYPQYIELMTFPDGVVLLNFIQSIDPLHSLFVYSWHQHASPNGKETCGD